MLFDKFIIQTKDWWSAYFRMVSDKQKLGQLSIESNGEIKKDKSIIILYPNMLLVTEFPGFFTAELIGGVKEFLGLTVKRHKEDSIYRYMSHFKGEAVSPMLKFQGQRSGLVHICVAQTTDFDTVRLRFPQVDLYPSKLVSEGGRGSPLDFDESFRSCSLRNSLIVNHSDCVYRCKNILHLLVVRKNITANELNSELEGLDSDRSVKGIHTISDSEERMIVAGQLQSLALLPGIRETTIGEFLKLHPEVVRSVFKSSHVEYEPSLAWVEHDGTCRDQFINPDMMVRREDGCFDIYDLKLALIKGKSITKAARSRRRFIDYVSEGIAQLANYREYFQYAGNVAHAKDKYGMDVKAPNLVLVVGSWESVNHEEVIQACRQYGGGIQVIDYDSLCQMFISAESGQHQGENL